MCMKTATLIEVNKGKFFRGTVDVKTDNDNDENFTIRESFLKKNYIMLSFL